MINTDLDINPFSDAQVPAVLERLVEEPAFASVVNYLWSDEGLEVMKQRVLSCTTVKMFQEKIMFDAITRVVDRSSKGLTISGLDTLSKDKKYLFIANHRDIILDSSILQILLVANGFETSEVTIGDNLIQKGILSDLFRLNKMRTVKREGSRKELYDVSVDLSNFIRTSIKEKGDSVWIAQRSGRTKDGKDITGTGLLKMLNISGKGEIADNFDELNIVPLAISYEYEPCDEMKAIETATVARDGKYVKAEGEDFLSIIKGLTDQKGRIHLGFGKPIVAEDLKVLNAQSKTNNEFIKELALLIDARIHKNYKLWPTNYVAHSILNNTEVKDSPYKEEELREAKAFLDSRANDLKYPEDTHSILLKIYANSIQG